MQGLLQRLIFTIKTAKLNKKLQVPFKNWHILKGDKVQVISGK